MDHARGGRRESRNAGFCIVGYSLLARGTDAMTHPTLEERARENNSCSVDGRQNHLFRKGFCRPHYVRNWKHGTPIGGKTPRDDAQRFILSAANHCGNECLIWPFRKMPDGRARYSDGEKSHYVSRMVCELVNGPAPTTKHEDEHSCGNGH